MIILILTKGSRVTNQVFKLELLVSETILQSLRTIDWSRSMVGKEIMTLTEHAL